MNPLHTLTLASSDEGRGKGEGCRAHSGFPRFRVIVRRVRMSATTGESGDGSDTVSALADSHRREEKGMRGSASLPIVVGRRPRRRPNFAETSGINTNG